MVNLTEKKYEVLKSKLQIYQDGTRINLIVGNPHTKLPDFPKENRVLVEDGFVRAIKTEEEPEKEASGPSPSSVDELPGEYGKKQFPCKNPDCPEGRNVGGSQRLYTTEHHLNNHLKRNPECAKFH